MNNSNWNKWAKYAALSLLAVALLLWVVIPAAEIILGLAGNFLFDYIEKHPVGVFIVACIIGLIVWFAYQQPIQDVPKLSHDPKPTQNDYKIIAKTVHPALRNLCETLGLTIRNIEAIMVDPADRILSWENVWGMKYKALKLRSVTDFDVERATSLIQAEIESVLAQYNPSKLSKTVHPYKGRLESVLQVAEVEDGDAYIYVYVVLATTDTYFLQKAADENDNLTQTEADGSDTDF